MKILNRQAAVFGLVAASKSRSKFTVKNYNRIYEFYHSFYKSDYIYLRVKMGDARVNAWLLLEEDINMLLCYSERKFEVLY